VIEAPVFVVILSCVWLVVFAVCLLLAARFVFTLLAAGVMQAWESWKGPA
jgi:hypothetical protein